MKKIDINQTYINVINIVFNIFFIYSISFLNESSNQGVLRLIISVFLLLGGVSIIIINIIAMSKKSSGIKN